MQPNVYVVILAGGIGTRFWPESRTETPKQFLDILNLGKTLLQATYERFAAFVQPENIYILTSAEYTDLVSEQLPMLQPYQILGEPARRNTGPAVAYMAYKLLSKDPEAVFVIAPSDHLITETHQFEEAIRQGSDFATQHSALVTLGINPTIAHTGYGYIQYDDEQPSENSVYRVKTFTEKPDLQLAQTFLESGDFLWNAGIFVWRAATVVEAFKQYCPPINDCFEDGMDAYNTDKEAEFIADAYSHCINKSIDYAIMEKAKNVYVIKANFGWTDLGTWLSLWKHLPQDAHNNAVRTDNALLYETTDLLDHCPGRQVGDCGGLARLLHH